MKLEHLISLVILYEEKSISKAAIYLKKSASTLRKELDELENIVNKKLFVITNKGVIFTEYGLGLYKYSKEIDYIINTTKVNAEQKDCTYIIAVDAKIILSEIFFSLCKESKPLKGKFVFKELYKEEVVREVISGKHNLGFINRLKGENLNFEQYGLVYIKVKNRQPVAILSKDHPLANRKSISLKELTSYKRISFENPLDNTFDFKYKLNECYGIEYGNVTTKYIGDLCVLLRNSNYYAIVGISELDIEYLDNLVAIRIEEMKEDIETGCIYNKNNIIDDNLARFISALK